MRTIADCSTSVKPRTARGLVRRAGRVEVTLHTADGRLVLVKVSKRQALDALSRASGNVEAAVPFEDGNLILGE